MTDYTNEDLSALFDALRAKRVSSPTNGDGVWEPPTPLVDWVEAYGSGDDPARWLAEPLLPDQGAVAIFAKGGTGKSLLALWLAAGLATGDGLMGPAVPVEVLYLDYEMTIRDVVERLEDMGYAKPEALCRLHYASLPSLAPLDTVEGGRAVVDMAVHLGVALVVIDTFGRAVNGEESNADTVRAWYRWTGQLLKAAGIGFLRVDHAGKDPTKGQRGTSAKNDDVDIVWEMAERGQGEFLLRATKRRVSWVEERVVLQRSHGDDGVLTYRWADNVATYRAGTNEVADLLDELGAPVDISKRHATALLRSAGRGKRDEVVIDALRYRREMSGTNLRNRPGQGFEVVDGTSAPEAASSLMEPPGNHPEPPTGPQPPRGGGVRSTPLGGGEGWPDDRPPPGLFDDPEEDQP